MRTLCLALLMSMFSPLFAQAGSRGISGPPSFKTRWVCATSHLTTSYAMIEHPDHFELQVQHHNGVEFMPIHAGIVTISDLPVLQEIARVLHQLGDRYVIELEKTECEAPALNQWVCTRSGPARIGGLDVENFQLRLLPRKIETGKSVHSGFVLDFSISKNKVGYTLPMDYDSADCRFE